MSQETVSFTIPATYSALSRTGNMLLEMAEDAASEEQRENRIQASPITMGETANTGDGRVPVLNADGRVEAYCEKAAGEPMGDHEKLNGDGTVTYQDTTGFANTGDSDAPLDHNGVPFNGEFCGSGEKPFYTSGAKTGQWKKKRGVGDEEYDAWYATELAAMREPEGPNATGHAEPPKPEVNTAAAFGGQQQQQQPANNMPVHRNGGELMTWVSEMQAAGRLTPQVLAEAWSTTGVKIAEAVSTDPAVAEPACRKMTEFLFQRLGG